MHFTSALVAAGTLALCSAAPAVDVPAELLQPRLADGGDAAADGLVPRNDQDVTFKLFAHTTCSHRGGPEHGMDNGNCWTLSADSHGLKITNHNQYCSLVKYQNGNCGGTGAYTMDAIGQCYDIGDDWGSMKAVCRKK